MLSVISKEVRTTMFDLVRHKAPGHNGYGAEFFLGSWDVVGNHIKEVVMNLFACGHLLREANMTNIALVLNTANSSTLLNFRPISYYNTIYMFITRILVTRIREMIPGLIGLEQSTFIPGRWIEDNILMAHEICVGIPREKKKGMTRCVMKIDIRKACKVGFSTYGPSVLWLS